jgi:hypothetical protein
VGQVSDGARMTDWVTYEKAFRMPLGIWTPVVRIAECYYSSAPGGRDGVDVSACRF